MISRQMIPCLTLALWTISAGAAVTPPGRDWNWKQNAPSAGSNNYLASATASSSYGSSGINVTQTSTYASSASNAAPTASVITIPSAVLQSCSASMDDRLPTATPSGFAFSGNVRKYYVAAEEVEWDYAPTGWDNWLGVPLNQSVRAQRSGYLQYGTNWLKALYRGYTDTTFTQRSEQQDTEGSLGPTLRAEVGDLIEIMFVNKLSHNYATMHSMGLAYDKTSEGADYPNVTRAGGESSFVEGNAVPPVDIGVEPHGCVVYKWMVPALAGPNNDEPARAHSYHSYVSLFEDANTGLIGPTIIYAAGQMACTMANYREFSLLYMIYNEAESWLSGKNAAALGGQSGDNSWQSGSGGDATAGISTQDLPAGNQSVWLPQLLNINGAGQFNGAPRFTSMNGYVFANNPTYEMCLNDKVIWYVHAYGSASHVFHMHGNGVTYQGEKRYAVSVNDGVGKALYMDATGQGLWQVICHVDGHLSGGMVSNYRVWGRGKCPLEPLGS